MYQRQANRATRTGAEHRDNLRHTYALALQTGEVLRTFNIRLSLPCLMRFL